MSLKNRRAGSRDTFTPNGDAIQRRLLRACGAKETYIVTVIWPHFGNALRKDPLRCREQGGMEID
jgi:hypothetical protein